MRKKEFIPMNLQLFAEPPAGGDGDAGDTSATGGKSGEGSNKTDPDNDDDNDVSLAEQVAQLKVQNAKLKKANDKATSEAAATKSSCVRSRLRRRLLCRKRQRKKPRGRNSFRSCFVKIQLQSLRRISLHLGYPADLAAKAATAQCDNDTDELFSIQQTFIEEKEKTMKADWMKSMPNPPAGNSDDDEDAFLKGFNM